MHLKNRQISQFLKNKVFTFRILSQSRKTVAIDNLHWFLLFLKLFCYSTAILCGCVTASRRCWGGADCLVVDACRWWNSVQGHGWLRLQCVGGSLHMSLDIYGVRLWWWCGNGVMWWYGWSARVGLWWWWRMNDAWVWIITDRLSICSKNNITGHFNLPVLYGQPTFNYIQHRTKWHLA